MSNDKNYYVKESDLELQLDAWRKSAKNVEDRIVSEQFARNIELIATHLLTHKRFSRYPQQDKDDMKQDAILKCIKNLKNIDTAKGSIFSYLTRVCWTAFIVYLGKYYKNLNERRQLLSDALGTIEGMENISYIKKLLDSLNETLKPYKDS